MAAGGALLRALFIEDLEADAELVEDALRQSGHEVELERVDSEQGLRAALARRDWDVVLSDHSVPGFGGFEALEVFTNWGRDVPFVIISGSIDQETTVELLRAGARDCVRKSDLIRLPPVIVRELADAQTRRRERAAESALRTSETRFRELLANIPDAVVRMRLTPEPAFDFVSPAVEAITGYTAEELIAAPELVFRIVHLDDLELFTEMLTAPDGRLSTIRLIRKDGGVVWVEQRAVAVYDEGGEHVATEAISRDVTDRVLADQRAEESNARLLLALDHGRMLLWEHDLETDELSLLGGDHRWAFGSDDPHTFSELVDAVHPEDREAFVANRDRLLERGEGEIDMRFLHPDGAEVWVSNHARLVPRGDDRPGTILATMVDITARKAAEQDLAATHATLHAIVAASPIAINAIDASRRVTIWNPAAERMLGWSADEVIGQTLPYAHADMAHAQQLLKRIFAGESVPAFETLRQSKSGTLVNVLLALAPLRGAQGEITGAVAMVSDITEQIEGRRQLEQSLATLQRVDGERRSLLARLVVAQEEERARIGVEIHDDSVQVLTALTMRLDLFRAQLDDPELLASIAELERVARSSIARLRKLIFELRPPALDRDGLAAALRLYLAPMRLEQRIESTIENKLRSEPGPLARTIVYRLAQEALANVGKHARASRVDITLEQSADGILVHITDDGRGFHGEEPESPQPGHIGLVSMRERAAMAGGWCKVSSIEGKGTSVEIFIPDDIDPAAAQAP